MAIDDADKLRIWNAALFMIGERRLMTLTENRESQRILTAVWDDSIDFCLEEGQWNFAIRTVQLDFDPGLEPSFGYRSVFTKPTDWVRTCSVATDEYFNNALLDYADESGNWVCDQDVIYVRYVSNSDQYGLNSSLWPQSFRKFVSAYLAVQIAPRFKNGSDAEKIEFNYKICKQNALNKDALQDPAKLTPPGSFVRSRSRGSHYRR